MYPAERAGEVLRFYRDFIAGATDDLGGACAFVTAPREPVVPEPVQGSQVFAVIVCYFGSIEEGEEAIRPLKEFRPPAVDMVGPMPYTVL